MSGDSDLRQVPCEECGGLGVVPTARRYSFRDDPDYGCEMKCPTCDANGWTLVETDPVDVDDYDPDEEFAAWENAVENCREHGDA